jgi:hypothetical protein
MLLKDQSPAMNCDIYFSRESLAFSAIKQYSEQTRNEPLHPDI